jgi:hypothetical protein
VPRLLNIETIENCMKLCPMIVQALWEYKSPFMQLPYITDDHLKHFDNKKVNIEYYILNCTVVFLYLFVCVYIIETC